MTTLPKFKSQLTGEELLPEHLLKGKRAYEQWATAGGTLDVESVFPYDSLGDLDRQRWVFFAKAYGDPTHHHSFAVKAPADVERHPELVGKPGPGMFEYDEAAHPTLSPPQRSLHDIMYELWVEAQQSKVRQHWWQFTRPRAIDTSPEAFQLSLDIYRKATNHRVATEPMEPLKKGDRLIDHINAQHDAKLMKEQEK